MKRKLLFASLVLGLAGILTGLARAQTDSAQSQSVSPATADPITQARQLYKKGDRSGATNLLAQIGPSDPNYGQARAWYALSLYALGDRAQFLAVADTPEVKAANLPDTMRDELLLKQYGVLYANKQFADLLPRLADYMAHSKRTKKLPLVTEYRMAALYEEGTRTVFAAAALPQGDAFNRQYAQGQTQLAELLQLVVARGKSDYLALPNRVLTEEVWLAQAALGMDADLNGDLPTLLLLLKDPEIRVSLLPDTLRADLEIREYEKLVQQHKYLELLPKLADFPERHPDSKQLWTAAEYRMAALYERGIKELADAAISKKEDSAAKRRADGQNYLVEFLNLAAVLNRTNYASLPQRNLQADVVQAHTALGNEAAIMQSLAPAEKERAALQTLQLHCKLQPRAVDEHLQRMTNFLNDYPNSKYRQRARYDLGESVLDEAWQRIYSEGKRGEAAPYLETARELLSGVVEVDKEGGVSEADVQEARSGILRIYYAQKDYSTLSDWAAQMITNSPPGGKKWVVAKLYNAAGLVNQSKLTEAAGELDEILTIGFTGHPSYDGHLVSAASWRIRVAQRTGDEATARRVAQQVQSSECYGSFKRTFVKKFGTLLLQQSNPVAK